MSSESFGKDLEILMGEPLSGLGKMSAGRLSKEAYKRGVTISESHIRNLVKGYDPSNLSPAELTTLSEILTGDKMYLLYRLGYFEEASKETFARLDAIYRRIYGN